MNPESPNKEFKSDEQIQKEETLETNPALTEVIEEINEEVPKAEMVQAETEEQRQDKIAEVRHKLGMPEDDPKENDRDQEKQEDKKERAEKEDVEALSGLVKRLSEDLDELSSTLSRNKFPKVRFDLDQLARIVTSETIDRKIISQGLGNLIASISRIRNPEDQEDWMAMEPHNFRSVIDGMEKVGDDLSKLKSVFDNAQSGDYTELSVEVSRSRRRFDSKKDDLLRALSALQKYKGR